MNKIKIKVVWISDRKTFNWIFYLYSNDDKITMGPVGLVGDITLFQILYWNYILIFNFRNI